MTDATTLDEAIKNVRAYDNSIHMVLRSERPRLARREALMIAALNEAVAIGKTDVSDPMFDEVALRIDTEDYEATQGHKPSGDGEWGFKFFDRDGLEYGEFAVVDNFREAKATAIQIANSEFRHDVTIIRVVA